MTKSSFSPPNILVVDDLNSNLSELTEIIHSSGYMPRAVTSARQAVAAMEALLPDLILMDISMPEIDGYMFCSMLKKSAKTRDIPVIFISEVNTPQDRMKGYRAGAVDFIAKPFEAEELMLRINTHLKIYKKQQEMEIFNKKMNKTINEQIRKIFEDQKILLHGLTCLTSKRCPFKATHLEHVRKNSRILAVGLQLSPKYRDRITNSYIDAIEVAAPLHDIGKMAISDTILSKIGQLSEEENELMKEHVAFGLKVIDEIEAANGSNDLLKMTYDIIKHHHERWDGSGYPEGLKGTDIPLSARIVAVVDAFDYFMGYPLKGKLHSLEESIEEINSKAGIYFDPDIIEIFNKIQNQLVK